MGANDKSFKKGKVAHKGPGRPAGAKNKVTYLSEVLESRNINIFDEFWSAVQQIDEPHKKAAILKDILDFIYPKPKVEIGVDVSPEKLLQLLEEYFPDGKPAKN